MTTTHVSWVESGVGFEGGWQDRTWRQQAWATLPGEFAVTGIRDGGGRCAGMQGGGGMGTQGQGECCTRGRVPWREKQLQGGVSGGGVERQETRAGRMQGWGPSDWGEGERVRRWKHGSFWFRFLGELGLPDLP